MKYTIFILVGIALVFMYLHLGHWALLETSEARYAEISKEMEESHDLLHPQLFGIKHFHKPPVTYYITMLGYKIAGYNEAGARLFLPVAIAIQLWLVYGISLLLFKNDQQMALVAALIYFSLPLVLISSRNLTTDAYLNTFILLSLFSWLSYKTKQNVLFLYLFYVGLGLIFETKGPVGFIFVFTFIFLFKYLTKERWRFSIHNLFGLLLFLLIALFWYISIYLENPNILNYFLNEQLEKRMIRNSYNRSEPFWYYLLAIPLLGIPWFVLATFYSFKHIKVIRTNHKMVLVLLWSIIIPFVLFSLFKTKLLMYLLPIFGFVAILSSWIVSQLKEQQIKMLWKVLVGIIAIFIVVLISLKYTNDTYTFNPKIEIVFIVVNIILIYFISKAKWSSIKIGLLSFLVGLNILLQGTLFLEQNQNQLNTVKTVIAYINKNLPETNSVYLYDYLMSSAQFYTAKNVILLNNGHHTAIRDIRFETNKNYETHLVNLKNDDEQTKFKTTLLNSKFAIISKVKNQPDFAMLNLNNDTIKSITFGRWILHYN